MKVWHEGLLFKIKKNLPLNYHILKSYLKDRHYFVKQGESISKLHEIHSGVPQGSVLGSILYLLYTADLPTNPQRTFVTYADDTAILAAHENPTVAFGLLQDSLDQVQLWLKTWRIRANETESINVTFTNRSETCPAVSLNGLAIPQSNEAKYLGMHLDRRLMWKKHIFMKRKQLGLQLSKYIGLLVANRSYHSKINFFSIRVF